MRKVGFFIYPGYQPLGLGVTAPFETANAVERQPVYDIRMISVQGGPIRTSLGFDVVTEPFDQDPYDLIIVGASIQKPSQQMIDLIKKAPSHCRRIAATCHGTFVLAAAGLLDGRQATTHWDRLSELRARYPLVSVQEDRIFMSDGCIWTSAGMTAGIDLALALIEEDHGSDTARNIARRLVVYHRRAGTESQFSALLDLDPKSDRIQDVLNYVRANLGERLEVQDLAERANLSPRQFSRSFHSETGRTPAKAVEQLRLEGARTLLENGNRSLELVARITGFRDRDRMRRAFLRAFDQPPHIIRRLAQRN